LEKDNTPNNSINKAPMVVEIGFFPVKFCKINWKYGNSYETRCCINILTRHYQFSRSSIGPRKKFSLKQNQL
jgi:hypothetical protein